MGDENSPNMSEVVEGGFGLNKACSDDESGRVVDGDGEDLELFPGPPLVRGAVVLEEVAVAFALPPAAGFGTAFEVFADMAADVRDGAFEGESGEDLVC